MRKVNTALSGWPPVVVFIQKNKCIHAILQFYMFCSERNMIFFVRKIHVHLYISILNTLTINLNCVTLFLYPYFRVNTDAQKTSNDDNNNNNKNVRFCAKRFHICIFFSNMVQMWNNVSCLCLIAKLYTSRIIFVWI